MADPAAPAALGGPAHHQFAAFGTYAFVAVTRPDAIDLAASILRHELGRIDLACSRFRTDSEISEVNRAGGTTTVVSPLLAEAVGVALRVAALTDGAVDPTVGAAVIGLGYDRDFAALSGAGAPEPAPRPAPGWRCVELDQGRRLVRVPAGVVLDLGATAKAWAADRAAGLIARAVGAGVLVNLGGDLSVQGAPDDGWSVGLALDCATAPSEAPAVVALRQGGLASSGTAVRTWERGNRRFHHIVDPRTGDNPRTCWSLVSVAAPTCVEANAASTAAIVWGAGGADRLSAVGLPARLVHHDGSVVTVNGWPPDAGSIGDGQGAAA